MGREKADALQNVKYGDMQVSSLRTVIADLEERVRRLEGAVFPFDGRPSRADREQQGAGQEQQETEPPDSGTN